MLLEGRGGIKRRLPFLHTRARGRENRRRYSKIQNESIALDGEKRGGKPTPRSRDAWLAH